MKINSIIGTYSAMPRYSTIIETHFNLDSTPQKPFLMHLCTIISDHQSTFTILSR